jgi:hypothetical protein
VIPVDAGVGLKFDLSDMLEIYGGGGATYYFLDSDLGDIDDEVGWYLEGGVELGIAEGFGVFAEVLWRQVEGTVEDDDVTLDDIDIDLEGVAVNVGVVLRW